MTALARWNPASDLVSMREAIGRLFDEAFVRPGSFSGGTGFGMTVPVDIGEERDAVIVRAAAPGLDPESIEITVQRGILTLKGRRSLYDQEEAQRYVWHMRGLTEGPFQVTASLPAEVNADAAQAGYEYGIVTVRLPKAESAKPKQIQVTAGRQREALPAGVA
jgi:HSP20 family protein